MLLLVRRTFRRFPPKLALATAVLLTLATGYGDAPRAEPGPDPTGAVHVNRPGSPPATSSLPGTSLYHLDATWTDSHGASFQLADLRGHPVLITMIYASCETACPILVRDAARTFGALPPEVQDDTRVLIVSFDPERDAPARLARYVRENDLDDPRWRFAVGAPHDTRALAALLGVRYRPAGNGMFSHSNLITVLDGDGVPSHRTEGLGRPVTPAIRAIEAAWDE
ncbi:MAG: SCO family protein [Trueperaceae bacterium]|nr:SCO family protein [Trueperaceae bacterium]